MAVFDIKVANHEPCQELNPKNVGSYVCYLHRWGQRGIQHDFVQFGQHNPHDLPIGAFASLVMQIAEARSKPFSKKRDRILGQAGRYESCPPLHA